MVIAGLSNAPAGSGVPLRRMLPVAVLLVTVSLSLVKAVAFEAQQRTRSGAGVVNDANAFATGTTPVSPINAEEDGSSWQPAAPFASTIGVHRVEGHSNRFNKSVPAWDYARHGADWTAGLCKIGSMQSPVDLHVDGLTSRRTDSLKEIFESVLQGKAYTQHLSDMWKRGDVVYSYRHLISSVQVLRTDKVFRLSIPADEGSTFGALFTTDRPNLYMATHIEFHSPSEHTFEGSANRRQIEVQIWHYYGDEAGSDAGIRSIETTEHTDMNVLVNTHESHLVAKIGKKHESGLEGEQGGREAGSHENKMSPNGKHGNASVSSHMSVDGDHSHKTEAEGGIATVSHGAKRSPDSSHGDSDNKNHENHEAVKSNAKSSGHQDVESRAQNEPGDDSHASHGEGIQEAQKSETHKENVESHGHHESDAVSEKSGDKKDEKHDEALSDEVVDVSGHKVNAEDLLKERPVPIGNHAPAVSEKGYHAHEADAKTKPAHGTDQGEDHGAHQGDEEEQGEGAEGDDNQDNESEESELIKNANFVNDEAGASFIEILSDVQLKDGSHIISPSSAQQSRHEHRGQHGHREPAEGQHSSHGKCVASAENRETGKAANSDNLGQGTGTIQTTQGGTLLSEGRVGTDNKHSLPAGHPLKSEWSAAYSELVESEQFELLQKYLLDHLHNAAYDSERDRRHVAEKRRARETGAHWGRWAVLSMTFMSEEMERTRIETLKTFPSERFMEQVLSVGSEVKVTKDSGAGGVGELGTAGNSELPVVELDVPINLSSLLMMLETKNLSYFAYDGSFTRPGCEETVRWYVAKEPLPVSTELMLQIHRMLNQTPDNGSRMTPVNKYRELQNVNSNHHNAGKVHLVHAYPMEYFIATSLDRHRDPPAPKESGFAVASLGIWAAVAAVAFSAI
ncbi:duplicated carbonic anhydrase, putative [Babesia caballi]|uniref:Duplicated carbonic anhydrase, putative n=1 Tax=Babesia caballi TaxID=5871 RepID=A0AAV4LNW7_BABCB|nr:duplicated carbonic anhydrase, putative [Babesia caballi]